MGVPLGTYLGQQVGWRSAFIVVAAIFAAATVCIGFFVPEHAGDPGRTFRAELRVFRIGQVWLTLAVGAIGFGGFFAVYSYVAPMVTEVAGLAAVGRADHPRDHGPRHDDRQLRGGVLADRNLKRTLLGGFVALAARADRCSR